MFKIIWKTANSGLNANFARGRSEASALVFLKSHLHPETAAALQVVKIERA